MLTGYCAIGYCAVWVLWNVVLFLLWFEILCHWVMLCLGTTEWGIVVLCYCGLEYCGVLWWLGAEKWGIVMNEVLRSTK